MPETLKKDTDNNPSAANQLPIHRDLTMGDIVQAYPETVEVMIEYGLHCFSCSISVFETLEQGARGHGFSETDIDHMLRDMNEIVTGKTPKG